MSTVSCGDTPLLELTLAWLSVPAGIRYWSASCTTPRLICSHSEPHSRAALGASIARIPGGIHPCLSQAPHNAGMPACRAPLMRWMLGLAVSLCEGMHGGPELALASAMGSAPSSGACMMAWARLDGKSLLAVGAESMGENLCKA